MPKKRTKKSAKAAPTPLPEAKARVLAYMRREYRNVLREPQYYTKTTWSPRLIGGFTKLPTARVTAALKSLEREGLTKYLGSQRVKEDIYDGGRRDGALSRMVASWVLDGEGRPAIAGHVSLAEVYEMRTNGEVTIEGEIYDDKKRHVIYFIDALGDNYRWTVTDPDALELFRERVGTQRHTNPTAPPATAAALAGKLRF